MIVQFILITKNLNLSRAGVSACRKLRTVVCVAYLQVYLDTKPAAPNTLNSAYLAGVGSLGTAQILYSTSQPVCTVIGVEKMESRINKLLLSKSTFYPQKNEKLPEIGMMPLPARYEKVKYWLL